VDNFSFPPSLPLSVSSGLPVFFLSPLSQPNVFFFPPWEIRLVCDLVFRPSSRFRLLVFFPCLLSLFSTIYMYESLGLCCQFFPLRAVSFFLLRMFSFYPNGEGNFFFRFSSLSLASFSNCLPPWVYQVVLLFRFFPSFSPPFAPFLLPATYDPQGGFGRVLFVCPLTPFLLSKCCRPPFISQILAQLAPTFTFLPVVLIPPLLISFFWFPSFGAFFYPFLF